MCALSAVCSQAFMYREQHMYIWMFTQTHTHTHTQQIMYKNLKTKIKGTIPEEYLKLTSALHVHALTSITMHTHLCTLIHKGMGEVTPSQTN